MATITQHAPGTFCWFELGTTDEAGAKKFYSELFGWTVVDYPMGDQGTYHMLQKNGLDVGAFYKLMDDQVKQGVPPHWMPYVSVESAANAAEKAKQLGGTVIAGPMDVMEHGRLAVIQDPTGAMFSVWEPLKHMGTGLLDEPGAQTWSELMTPDTDKAAAFYTGLFPWKSETMPMPGASGTRMYTIFKRGDANAAGLMANPPEAAGVPPHWMTYFAVESTSAAVARATSLGAKILHPETPTPYGAFAILQDPQGAAFAVIEAQRSS
jgi:predicted enzyme related to lactoylglutathione lyase